MSEQETTQITPQMGATNETLLGDFTSYFRWNEESRQYEMNVRISPTLGTDSWVVAPSPVRDAIVNPDRRPAVGTIIYDLNNTYLRANREKAAADELRQQAHQAIAIIGERLIQEAEERGWCDEFDKIIDEVNESLPGVFELPTRRKPRRKVRVSISTTVTTYEDVYVEEGCDDEDDPDNWYEDDESEYALGHDWAHDKLMDEINYNGFDDVECSVY